MKQIHGYDERERQTDRGREVLWLEIISGEESEASMKMGLEFRGLGYDSERSVKTP